MIKKTFFYNTSFLIITGLIVRLLGLIHKIVLTRILGIEGISLYSLGYPSIILFTTLASFGLPIAITKIVSENCSKRPYSNRNVIKKGLLISIIVSVLLMVIFIFLMKPICKYGLKNMDLYYPLIISISIIPFVSVSGVLKGYFDGLKKMDIPSIALIIEQIVRMIFSIGLSFYLLKYGIIYSIIGVFLSVVIGEAVSLLYLIYKVFKTTSIKGKSYEITEYKRIFEIACPNLGSKLVMSVTHFLEPIVFTLSINLSKDLTMMLYGSVNSYVLPLLTIFSFISFSIGSAIIPIISESYALKDLKKIRKIVKFSLFLCFIPIGIWVIILLIYPFEIMNLLFNETFGYNFIIFLIFPLFLLNFNPPLSCTLQSINKSSDVMYSSIIISILRIFLIFVLCSIPEFNIYGYLLSIFISSTTGFLINLYNVNKYIKLDFNIKKIIPLLLILVLSLLIGLILKRNLNYVATSIIMIFIYVVFIYKIRKNYKYQ